MTAQSAPQQPQRTPQQEAARRAFQNSPELKAFRGFVGCAYITILSEADAKAKGIVLEGGRPGLIYVPGIGLAFVQPPATSAGRRKPQANALEMRTSRAGFLTAAAASTLAPALAETAGAAGDDLSGMTFTMLRVDEAQRLGVRTPSGVVDVTAAGAALGVQNLPVTTDDVVRGHGDMIALKRVVANAPASTRHAETAVDYAPVVNSPGKILCVGLNYRAHIAETGAKQTATPELFNKFNSALNRHNGTIPVSAMDAKHFDYESELVAVIGKRAKNVSESAALGHVFGYAAGNDFTARDLQHRVTQWMTGKTPDLFAPLGPWLVTADLIGDPQTLQVQTFVNDETSPRQNMSTAQMIFPVATLISYISNFITLDPGDIIFTGTPSGVIDGMPPDKQIWLKPGDRIHTKITKLGSLRFTLT